MVTRANACDIAVELLSGRFPGAKSIVVENCVFIDEANARRLWANSTSDITDCTQVCRGKEHWVVTCVINDQALARIGGSYWFLVQVEAKSGRTGMLKTR